MNPTKEILLITIPAFLIFLTSYLLIRSFLRNEDKKRRQEMIMNNQKVFTPVRLQAYERLTLFLERISPESLLKRVHKKGMTVSELQTALLKSIRSEFEHNFSQQIYMSHQTWHMVLIAKENIVKLINGSASRLKPDAPAINLSKILLEQIMEMDKTPSARAIEEIKKEVQQLF